MTQFRKAAADSMKTLPPSTGGGEESGALGFRPALRMKPANSLLLLKRHLYPKIDSSSRRQTDTLTDSPIGGLGDDGSRTASGQSNDSPDGVTQCPTCPQRTGGEDAAARTFQRGAVALRACPGRALNRQLLPHPFQSQSHRV